MFSNTKSVKINGKEVKSIILENGAILYEKDESYLLTVTSDKNILSYYDNDVATLTANLTKGSTPIEGEEVIFHTPNVTIGIEEYYTQNYNCIEMNLEGDGEIILPNSTQFGVQAFTEDGTNVVWEDLSKGDWKIKINNGELNFCLGTNASPSEQSSFVGNKFSIKIFSKTSNDLYEISSSYPVFFASAITQNNGQCSVTYDSQGVGDVPINVECMNLQETYELEDNILYDGSSIDKTSNYSIKNLNTHTFSTDHYEASRTMGSSPSSTYYSLIYPTLDLPTDFEVSVDMYAPSKETDKQFGLCVSNIYTETYIDTNQCFLYANLNRIALGYRVNGSLTNYGVSSSYSTNTWYTFKIKVVGTIVTTQILDGSTVIQSWSGTLSNIQSWKKVMLITGGQSNTIRWKNFKIKPL